MSATPNSGQHSVAVSVVVPIYRGAETLPMLISELLASKESRCTPKGRGFRIEEVLLVWDHGPDDSERVIRELSEAYSGWVHPVWLSRNFGQHAATVAGIGATGGEWVVTLDEDGQHDPEAIGEMLDAAYEARARLVYAAPANTPPHGLLRNTASWFTKKVMLPLLTSSDTPAFHSYRLIAGDVARAVAAYAGPNVYLDVALGWITTEVSTIEVQMRTEGREATNYKLRSLLSHFWKLVLSSGNRPLRAVSVFGGVCASVGLLYALWLVLSYFFGGSSALVSGWTSVIVCVLVLGGVILGSLGIIAEYLGLAATMSMGRPAFVVLSDPARRFGPNPRVRGALSEEDELRPPTSGV